MAIVFISYRKNDARKAEQLAEEIRASGYQVWLDEWVINTGDSIIERINDGLTVATYVILCCSSSGNNSPWMSREWMSALARQLNGYNVKILPVLLTGGSLPPILSDIRCADLVKDWERGISELLKSIGS
jgi:hypothetical protein